MSRSKRFVFAASCALILVSWPVSGQMAAGEATISGWHIVRGGDTLMYLAEDYLGSKERWKELWRLNPEIENPHFLRPGQRLRVAVAPELAVPTAQMRTVAGRVENKPAPLPWERAREADLLVEQDGVRTHEASSTRLDFVDGTSVVLTEDSLVFVRRSAATVDQRRRRSDRRRVEVVEGQADVATAPELPDPVAVEIVVAGATARPQRAPGEASQTRARAAAGGGAELMVYEGDSEVEAAGRKVAVPEGMGTAVPQGAPPSPPEKLLAAPTPMAPPAGTELGHPDPTFAWEAVPGAVSYAVEVCRDAGCSDLVRRVGGVGEARLRMEGLPVAELYWRVTAVSASGLDGYPSPGSPFVVLTDQADAAPPTGRIVLTGRQVEIEGRTLYDGAAGVEVRVEDAGSGVAGWTARVNGSEVPAARLKEGWESGSYRIEVEAWDRAGNRAALAPVSVEVDADPPLIAADVGWVLPVLRRVRPGLATPRWLRAKRRFAEWGDRSFRDAAGGRPWLVLASGSDQRPIADSYRGEEPFLRDPSRLVRELVVAGDRPEAILLAPGLVAGGERLDDGRLVWIHATDQISGVDGGMRVRTEGAELVVEAEDAVGNRARRAWPLR